MATIKTFGEQEVFTTKELKNLQITEETRKYAIPLEVDIYGDILIHHFWPTGKTVDAKYLHGHIKFHDLKLYDYDEDNNNDDKQQIINMKM